MTKKKTTAKKSAPAKASRRKRILMWTLKIGLALLAALALYCVYLDGQVRSRFEGQTFQLPAQIYSRPLALYAGAPLSRDQLIEELRLLKYRKVANPDQPGEFSASDTKVEVFRRTFLFPEGQEPARRLMVVFDGDRVDEVYDSQSQQPLAVERVEPLLVELLSQSTDEEERIFVPLEEMPPLLPKTLIQVEDRKFYEHYGVSPLSIARAFWVNMKAGHTVQGGSTLTQQLAKNFFLTREKSLVRKFNEALMALIIDLRYDKDRILEAYLNEIFLGQASAQAVHGMGLASRFYFGRPASELTPDQVALLVGIIKGPSYYDPRRHPDRARKRRDLVLKVMLEDNLIDSNTYQRSVMAPLGVSKERNLLSATVPAYMQAVRRELAGIVQPFIEDEQGVRVFTGLEPLAQKALEKAIDSSFANIAGNKPLEMAAVVSDPRTGLAKAMAGGKTVDFAGFNRALDAKRQIGSLAKPAVYLTALSEPEFNLATPLDDQPVTLRSQNGDVWEPKNYDRQFRGKVALVDALSHSLNVPTVNLGMKLGVPAVLDTFRALGVHGDLPPYPSVFLGTAALSPWQVNQMYLTLAKGGAQVPLAAVSEVTSGNGKLLWKRSDKAVQTVSKEGAFLTDYALTEVMNQGTGRFVGRRFPGKLLAGKTGTTDDLRDSWFSGFDARDVATFWVGQDDNGATNLTGATGALRLYGRYLDYRRPISLRLRPPSDVVDALFDEEGNYLGDCNRTGRLLPADGRNLPEVKCDRLRGFLDRLFGN
ncbi:penicillin-binding protein 1B [Gallaecimonas xiamenensis]|uniref:Penicillin-binding protein 1B n=1 Tax=Gallaecimonas xiamenensis 3-C-1 TaxID=745411 RepID=K2JGK3_9GAMM|nr:penicillin-binding protein 1B [Gallaecimonas xiamenensis]EKE73677.1 membrane carboxypeptidase [Gallaecimonas xiamenensis 3-C-1]